MKPVADKGFEAHLFVCVNERDDGRAACHGVGGLDFYTRMKAEVKTAGLSRRLKVTRTGCLGLCNPVGCTLTIYRPGKDSQWFTEVTAEDYESIWAEFTRQGK